MGQRRWGRRALSAAAAVSLLVLSSSTGPAVAAGEGDQPEWNYGEFGPATWPGSFPSCGGALQSPIDLQEVAADPANGTVELVIDYDNWADVTVFNNTHTVEAEVEPGAGGIRVALDGQPVRTYELLQFHFHTPSEHELSGYDQEAELHLVHKAADGSQAVVSVLFERGSTQSALNSIWRDLPDVDDERRIEVDKVRLASLIPPHSAAYHYVGSLTTPPCTEDVDWFVMDKVDSMSLGQLRQLRGIFSGEGFPSGNARPTQRIGVDGLGSLDVERNH